MKKIAIVTTLWSSIDNWIKPFLNEYRDHGIDVTVICNMSEEYEQNLKAEFPFVHTKRIAFPRGIHVWRSLKSIRELKKFFRSTRFDLVQYATPNASFYTSIAAKSAKIPIRLYCQWGMVYVTMTGIKRKLFYLVEKIICRSSTNVQPDSKGNLEFCRKAGFYGAEKSEVIWNGSAKGIDLSKFDFLQKEQYAAEIKRQYSIPSKVPVIGFVGRLGREKGCNELFSAFRILKEKYPDLRLLFVGPIEKEETIDPELLDYFKSCSDIIKTDRVKNIEKYISAMDVFVLPTYREGFGMSVIEASAMKVPVIVTKYPGPCGAVIPDVTGFAIDIKSVDQLVEKIDLLLSQEDLRKTMGENGRKFVEENFEQKEFIKRYMENRLSLLEGTKQ